MFSCGGKESGRRSSVYLRWSKLHLLQGPESSARGHSRHHDKELLVLTAIRGRSWFFYGPMSHTQRDFKWQQHTIHQSHKKNPQIVTGTTDGMKMARGTHQLQKRINIGIEDSWPKSYCQKLFFFGFIYVPFGSFMSLLVPSDAFEFLQFTSSPFGFLWVSLGFFGFLWVF